MSEDERFGLNRQVRLLGPLPLDSGAALAPVEYAYETYGTLNADASNAILICHALTGDQYVASKHPLTGKDGWWVRMVGPGKPIDTDRHFVICSNVIGSCLGSSGPATINPATDQPWGMDFPVLTIADMVRAQDAARPSRDRAAACSRWRFNGRDAVSKLGCTLSGPGQVGGDHRLGCTA